MFLKLKYPAKLIDSTFKRFHASQDHGQSRVKPADGPVLITLSFKDQKFADSVHSQATKRPLKENPSCIATSFHKSENLRRSESYGNKAHTSKPAMCCVCISMRFVLHDPSSSPPHRGAQMKDNTNKHLTIFTSSLPPLRNATENLGALYMRCFL